MESSQTIFLSGTSAPGDDAAATRFPQPVGVQPTLDQPLDALQALRELAGREASLALQVARVPSLQDRQLAWGRRALAPGAGWTLTFCETHVGVVRPDADPNADRLSLAA
jgi:hypothetical protein